jgi:hypothetical protein
METKTDKKLRDRKQKQVIRPILTEINKIFAPFRKKFGVKLGLRLCDTQAEIFAMKDGKMFFGVDVSIYRGYRNDKATKLNFGSLGALNPADDEDNGAALAHMIATTVKKWDKIEPLMNKAFEDYEEAFPRNM